MARALPTLSARRAPLASPDAQRALLRRVPIPRDFDDALAAHDLGALHAGRIDTLQLNLGKLCNQSCRHCHVDAGPDRREQMSRETMVLCVAALAGTTIPTVDITGGAPELVPHFRWLVETCASLGRHVIDRCNLTVLETPSARDLPALFARLGVEVVASLPHTSAAVADRQRGEGVFATSIRALRRLNEVGYGAGDPARRLTLVANPVGAFLPADQATLEAEWRRELLAAHGISFDRLLCITNMPISRYLDWLHGSGNLDDYLQLLVDRFNPAAARAVMCRTTISVAWDGTLHDCDFNQMLAMPVLGRAPRHVRDFDRDALEQRAIAVDRHCFGCTAGAGSSCGGATAS